MNIKKVTVPTQVAIVLFSLFSLEKKKNSRDLERIISWGISQGQESTSLVDHQEIEIKTSSNIAHKKKTILKEKSNNKIPCEFTSQVNDSRA